MTARCAICGGRRTVGGLGRRRVPEQPRPFTASLRVLGIPGSHAHTSCLLAVVAEARRKLVASGTKMPFASAPASAQIAAIEEARR